MLRFVHSVEEVVFLDGDDVRRAPMAAALFRRFADQHPVLSLWRIRISSAGSGKYTVNGASADEKAKQATLAMGADTSSLSYHKAATMSLSDIEQASIVLAIETKHKEEVDNKVCSSYPAYRGRIITFMDYLWAPDIEFGPLIGSNTLSDYLSFAQQIEGLFPRLSYRFMQDAHLPLLAKGKGLGSGVVRGPARIVTSIQQARDISKGDVLVCDTNHIEDTYGRAAELASAIVTDQASEMSLLSQIAHDLKVPCVGGTTHATRVIHDGMSVLVDATAGLVYGINEEG
jgi:phosphohistidine swiveling domain-containing protein/protein-tyrosine-phosphatase